MGTRLARILEVIARKLIKTKKLVHLDNNNPLERRDWRSLFVLGMTWYTLLKLLIYLPLSYSEIICQQFIVNEEYKKIRCFWLSLGGLYHLLISWEYYISFAIRVSVIWFVLMSHSIIQLKFHVMPQLFYFLYNCT